MVETPLSKKNDTPDSIYVRSEKNRKAGILWLTVPAGLLVATPIVFAILTYATTELWVSETVRGVFNVTLAFIGLVGVIALLIGIPLGIIFLTKKELKPGAQYDKRSGNNHLSEIPPEIKKWSWGAAGLGWIWGAYHSVWISLLGLIPFWGYIWWIVMGRKGNEWAWQKNKWVSVDDFLTKQRKWNQWGLAFFIVYAGLAVMVLLSE
ncbi:MAG: hypothetical protein UY92_C0002G0027 [Candidatus Magasanikbacteria bacterium GW2011_GWA2_56_11]|uniref:Uncharacterized protein n=1 Tax=Candidatus Magasanikbacteria bacterium GW2011_GWA2_56_11 TaxID=1619044 RepID=A0A0G1YI59_9BACT|nr:MAG: hypothetical protein UY92_C0002G0027 [Candidatus Magasanikbacteria bacterium GW2011_GWA2_56_11]